MGADDLPEETEKLFVIIANHMDGKSPREVLPALAMCVAGALQLFPPETRGAALAEVVELIENALDEELGFDSDESAYLQ
jgi:hypothetical protein